uniref:Terminase_6C domain-containing protein n=1 Tax=Caenorhabditis tropicalis TaxID=1561998 RepID=A0A1I7T4K4_9PELO
MIASECSSEQYMKDIEVSQFPTKRKVYWGVSPKKKGKRSVFVVLGIRNESEAISLMKRTFKGLKTYGTSAYGSTNKDFDQFYNYAIGVNDTGLQTIYDEQGNIVELKDLSTPSFFTDVLKEKPPLIPYKYEELPICDLTTDSPKPLHNSESIVNEFFKCASMILLRFSMNPQGMLFNWPYTIYVCDEEDFTSKIPLRSFDNGQKQYWAVLPNCVSSLPIYFDMKNNLKQEKTTLVTLGASENSKSEEDIKGLLKDFDSIGIDPFHGKNSAYDKFNQVALSTDNNKLLMADSNDKYSDKNYVATVNQQKFFNETVGVKKIDMLWINPNAGNFEYEKYLNKDGEFEKMGIKVCQINIEITKNDAEKWSKLITPLVQEKRFIFMRPMSTEGGDLTRTFLLNVADPECIRKYLH